MNEQVNNKAFDEGRMDDLMRETLEGYRVEPAPGLWKGISRKLFWRDLAHFNFRNLSPRIRIAGTAGILLLAAIAYFGMPVVSQDVPPAMPAKNIPFDDLSHGKPNPPAAGTLQAGISRPGAGSAKVLSASAPVLPAANVKSPVIVKKAGQNKSIESEPKLNAYAKNIHPQSVVQLASNNPVVKKETPAVSSGNITAATPLMRDIISPLSPYEATGLWTVPLADTIITITTPAGNMKFLKSKPSATQFFSADLGVTPEIAFYPQPESYSKFNVWINGGITYHISRFSIATGLGLGYVYDQGSYITDYKSRDSVGYYSTVVSYTTGTNNEIIYNTVNQSVYDSLLHSAGNHSLNRYTYLQVPLLLGYRLFETNSISLTFQAGPAVSFLLGSRESDPVIDYPGGRLISVNENTPARINTNWQVWANLYLEIRMNRRISLYLEPSCKYFLNPMVDQENVSYKAPWTVGLGVGIQFNFGQKKSYP